MKIYHKFRNHRIDSDTETLIIGTFNPDIGSNPAEFFYGRGRNYLWRLLSQFYGYEDLKGADIHKKTQFISQYKIDFVDLIEEIEVPAGSESKLYEDDYLDDKVVKWKDIQKELKQLRNLKRVCLTRKSFSRIPNIKERIDEIQRYCEARGIHFQFLVTPARFYNQDKQEEWNNFLSYGAR